MALGVLLVAPALASATSPSGVVISQLRLRTAASQYDEYVQLTNTGSSTVDLSGWQLYDCYTSGGSSRIGTDGDRLPSGTRLPAGSTFVLGKNAGDYTGTADASYTFQVTEAGGFQIRDGGGVVQDGVGAGGTACAEGTGLTFPTTGSDFTFTRHGTDTDDNAADFGAPSGSANGTACGAPCVAPPQPTAIDAIQGSGMTSPLVGQKVSITGVVIGVDNQQGVSNYVNLDPRQAGIYVETPTIAQDTNTQTSEGIFVGGLAAADRAASHIGQTVTVSGTVTELFNLTTLDASGQTPAFTGTAKAANLPAAVTIDTASARAQTVASSGNRPYYETLEGMRVTLPSGTLNGGGTDKFGETFLQPDAPRKRVFRDAATPVGPADQVVLGQDAGSADVDPTNPSETPASTTRVKADLFDKVTGATGPLGFAFSQYQIQPQPGSPKPVVVKGPTTYPPDAPAKAAGQLRIANFNMENLFGVGMTDDGHTFTQAEIDAKTTRLANAIKVLHKPDILAVEEVASEDSLKEVAAKVGGYQEVWRPSTDARHVAVGFLVRNGIDITDVRQLGVDATTTESGCQDAGVGTKLFERPPLEISVKVRDTRFTLIGNHWASQGHPEACREAQASFVASAVSGLENFGAQVVVLGDLNDFEDSTAISSDLVAETTLRNLWTKAPAQNRYSYSYNGMLQTLDHILVTKGLWKQTLGLQFVHFDNDYYERNETTSPTKVSDHDPPVATLALG
ncbi:lamin tail domain-containing protein [Conexibacter woesei]|uniref:endonuclease/exonuclease/phosphatase family protein n=1 Tax=Conexibacter woesei TaxID=191495 RepID=UPI00047C8302|nr:lamin tail domain-containing protein [Conexibacter woesei]